MNKFYLVILVLIAVVSSLWAEPVRSDDKPVSFFGIEMGEYIPQDAKNVTQIDAWLYQDVKAPKGFDGCRLTVSPLTRRVTAAVLTRRLSTADKATQWVDTLISGLALAANAQLVYVKDQKVYSFVNGRLNVTIWQEGSNAYLHVSDGVNDGIHTIIAYVREKVTPVYTQNLPAVKAAPAPAPAPVVK